MEIKGYNILLDNVIWYNKAYDEAEYFKCLTVYVYIGIIM